MTAKTTHPLAASCLAMLGALLAVPAAIAELTISEFMAKNDATLATSAGEFVDWIEIRNGAGEVVSVDGWYLSDDPDNLTKWRIPSTMATTALADGDYLVVFADSSVSPDGSELHASFKLSSGGEYLALTAPDGVSVEHEYRPSYPVQQADVSYGIDPDTGLEAYFVNPTPGADNTPDAAVAVEFSAETGTFTDPFTLVLTGGAPASSIRYTLDGSIPTATSPLYGSGIPIASTTRVRAQVFEAGLPVGSVASGTYYHLGPGVDSFASNLPIVVIDNFGAGNIPSPDAASRQACGMMIFDSGDGDASIADVPAIVSRAGIRRRGESSLRTTANKPNLSLETWGDVDEDSRDIEPFGFPAESDWVLFAPWAFDRALMRNSFIYEVSNAAGRYAVRTRFVEVFLNHGGGVSPRTTTTASMSSWKKSSGGAAGSMFRNWLRAPLAATISREAISGRKISWTRMIRRSRWPGRLWRESIPETCRRCSCSG